MPINPVCGVTCGRICVVSATSNCSASGRMGVVMECRSIQVSLQYMLRCDLVNERLAFARYHTGLGQTRFGRGRSEALVDELDRQSETDTQLARELTRKTR